MCTYVIETVFLSCLAFVEKENVHFDVNYFWIILALIKAFFGFEGFNDAIRIKKYYINRHNLYILFTVRFYITSLF